MDKMPIKVVLEAGASLPEYKTEGSSGADLRANLTAAMTIEPLARAAVPTGVRLELPDGYEAQVRPRSGLALEKGLTCLNSPGTIDSDYRGEIKVILVNLGSKPVRIEPCERIAQLVVAGYTKADFRSGAEIAPTGRGEGGFGSTGA
jgi:dUTP pyrophosphatase